MKDFPKMKKNALIVVAVAGGSLFQIIDPALTAINVQLNGQPLNTSVAPVKMRARAMVPMRNIFEALGATVTWNPSTMGITAQRGSTVVNLAINNPRAYINGREVSLDQSAMLWNGRTMVPLRFVSEAMGAQVDWNEALQLISIDTPVGTVVNRRTAMLPLANTALTTPPATSAEDTQVLPQRAPNFIPLGVYWPGESTWNDLPATERWKQIEDTLDLLQKQGVNAIWLTHLSASTTAEFARRAAPRGIYLVASLGELAGNLPKTRSSDHKALIEGVIKEWGDAPAPIAWGLGDEPRSSYMNEMARYVSAWKKYAPREPITAVAMSSDYMAAANAGFSSLTMDVYPFFSKDNPNRYSARADIAWTSHSQKQADLMRNKGDVSWMMGQAYQEPRGPFEISPQGNIVYLPGGAPHLVMPTPTQIRWQAWAAFATGSKGMFYFVLRGFGKASDPDAQPTDLPATVKEKTDLGAPRALLYDDNRPTPQFAAMGEAFKRLSKLAAIIAPLKQSDEFAVWLDKPAVGDIANLMVNPTTNKRYVFAVAGYEGAAAQIFNLNLAPQVVSLKNVETGATVKLGGAAPFRRASFSIAPGDGILLECEINPATVSKTYAPREWTNAELEKAIMVANVRVYPLGEKSVLSAAGTGNTKDNAFVVWDTDKLLGPLPNGGMRALRYDSAAHPAEFRGVFWSVSDDNRTWRPLSNNEPGQIVTFKERYLKVGISWNQAGGPEYGNLQSIEISQ